MMRFNKIIDGMREALFQFCMEQSAMNGYTSVEEIEALVNSAFDVFNRIPATSFSSAPVYRYQIYAGEELTDEIFPEEIRENGKLFERSIHFGTFMIDGYSACTDETKGIARGYDVVYDFKSGEIKLLYSVMTTDDSVTTIYRVETDVYEDFNLYEFMIDISSQIIGKLNQSVRVPFTVEIREVA